MRLNVTPQIVVTVDKTPADGSTCANCDRHLDPLDYHTEYKYYQFCGIDCVKEFILN